MREITLQDFDGIDLNVEDDSETRNLDMLASVASHLQYLEESLEDNNNVQDLTLTSKKSRKVDSVPNQFQGYREGLTVFGDSVVQKRRRSWLPPPPPHCSVTDVEFRDQKLKFDRCAADVKIKPCDDVDEKKRFSGVEFQEKRTKFDRCDEVCDDVEEKLRQKRARDVEFQGKKMKFEVCDDVEEKSQRKRNRDVGFREKENELVLGGAQTMIRKKRKFEEKSRQEKGAGSKRLILKLRPPPLNLAAIATPVLPESYLKAITELSGGWILSWDDMELVIQKKLHNTDLTKHHNRLSIPSKQMKCGDFLYGQERTFLLSRNSKNKRNYMNVKIVEPNLKAGKVKLSMWESNNLYYVFKGTWSDIVNRNELKEGMVLQVWTYRVQQELWFALLKVPQVGGLI